MQDLKSNIAEEIPRENFFWGAVTVTPGQATFLGSRLAIRRNNLGRTGATAGGAPQQEAGEGEHVSAGVQRADHVELQQRRLGPHQLAGVLIQQINICRLTGDHGQMQILLELGAEVQEQLAKANKEAADVKGSTQSPASLSGGPDPPASLSGGPDPPASLSGGPDPPGFPEEDSELPPPPPSCIEEDSEIPLPPPPPCIEEDSEIPLPPPPPSCDFVEDSELPLPPPPPLCAAEVSELPLPPPPPSCDFIEDSELPLLPPPHGFQDAVLQPPPPHGFQDAVLQPPHGFQDAVLAPSPLFKNAVPAPPSDLGTNLGVISFPLQGEIPCSLAVGRTVLGPWGGCPGPPLAPRWCAFWGGG